MFEILKEVDEIRDWIIATRQQFHQCPELGMQEIETTKMIAAHLDELGIPYDRFEPTGLVAYLGAVNVGNVHRFLEGTRTVALRADIDGLLVEEQTGLPFASKIPGQMHACGHDGHITGLLGAARILKAHESEIVAAGYVVKLIFQPSEENALGARKIIEQGCLDGVEEIFGVHIFSDIPVGQVSIEAGPRMAATDRFKIRLIGKSGHGAKPHECVDATIAAAALAMNLQTIISRRLNPIEPGVLTIGRLQSGTAYNVISGEAVLEGTVRTFSVETEEMVKQQLIAMAEMTASMYGCDVEVEYPDSLHGPLINDSSIAKRVKDAATSYFGEEAMGYIPQMMLGEDFANYLEKVPGVFAFVGGGKPGVENFLNHHNRFDFDEESLIIASKVYIIYIISTILKISSR